MRVASRIAFGERQSGNRNPKKDTFLHLKENVLSIVISEV